MNEHALREQLIETALAAELHNLVRLPGEFHAANPERRGEMAAWIVQCLLARSRHGERAVLDFWDDRTRLPSPPRRRDKPRVGLLSPTLLMGGAERWIVDLACHLDHSRLDVVGIGVHTWQGGGPLLRRAVQTTAVMFHEKGCQYLACNVDALICWGVAGVPDGSPKCSIYVSHGASPCAERWGEVMAKKPVKLAAVSRWAARVFPPGSDVAVIHNGVDPTRCVPQQPREKVRAQWGLKPGEIAIGHVGRLGFDKNPAAAAMAASALGKGYRAVYVGTGLPEHVRMLRHLRPEPIIRPYVEHIGDVFATLDCFVLASPSEGFSLALTEAWISGCPTVATRVGAIPELEERFGQLTQHVPVSPSGAELAEAVKRALSPENRHLVAHAQSVARKHFTVEMMGKRWTDYILKTLNE